MREPAPPYAGEGPHALWHVSEDAAIERFVPHHEPLHAGAGIELRVVPSLLPLWERVVAATLGFSGIRLRNATLAR